MKRLILSASLAVLTFNMILSVFYPTKITVDAITAYVLDESEITERLELGEQLFARALDSGIYIYSDNLCTDKLFELPTSYYVKVIEYNPTRCRIIYCYEDYDYARGIPGYALSESLTFVSEPPTGRSFPNIFPEFEGNGTFYKNNKFDSYYSAADTASDDDAFFYGYYIRGNEKFCYVLRGGKFGYYPAEIFKQIEIPRHADAFPVVKTPQSSPTQTESDEYSESGFFSSDTNKVIFIAICCVIAICAMYMIFLPKRQNAVEKAEYYDESDDEE